MLTEAKLRRICAPANTGTALLNQIPKTCQWGNILRISVKRLDTPFQLLGLDFIPGAIFTGPEGNGRHTHANALANNLVDKAGYRAVFGIHGSDLNFEDPDDLFDILDYLEKIAMGNGRCVLLLDQPELSDHSLQFQNQLLRLQQSLQASQKILYLILITGSGDDVAPALLSRFPQFHCPKPNSNAISAFVEDMLKNPVPIHMDKVTKPDILNALKGCSWKQLKDLHNYLLRTLAMHYQLNFKKFKEKGYTEEQVYKEGLITLPNKDVKAILASVASQNPLPPTPVMPAISPVVSGIPATQPPLSVPTAATTSTVTEQEDSDFDPNSPIARIIMESDDPIAAFMTMALPIADGED